MRPLRPLRLRSHRPRNSSLRWLPPGIHSAYTSAVSRTLPPKSTYLFVIASDTESSTPEPNSAVPRQSTEASRVVRGIRRVLIDYFFDEVFSWVKALLNHPISFHFPVVFQRDSGHLMRRPSASIRKRLSGNRKSDRTQCGTLPRRHVQMPD